MKRSTQLRRKTPIRRKALKRTTPGLFSLSTRSRRRTRVTLTPAASRFAGAAVRNSAGGRLSRKDPAYVARVKLMPCCARRLSGCTGPVDPHHAGGLVHGRGVGLKPPDRTCIALCRGHHDALHDGRYPFSVSDRWTKSRRRRWQDAQIARTQKELDAPPFDEAQDREDEAAEAWSVGEVQVHDW